MQKNIFFTSLLLVVLGVAFSCTPKVESKPSFEFKTHTKDGNTTLAAKIDGQEITYEKLYEGVENEIYEAKIKLYELKFNRLKAVILEHLMNKHPGKKGLSNDEFFDKFISKNKNPTQKEIDEFIKQRGIPKESVNDKMKERIVNFLSMENKKKDIELWLAEQSKKHKIEVFFDKPERPSFEVKVGEAPYLGNKNAKVTIVEFSDFQCPFCKKGSDVMNQVKKKYGDKVKIVFKHFPLPFHINAKKAAEAAMCSFEQSNDKFWKMHDRFFDDQSKLNISEIKATAKEIGLDVKKFNDCLDSGKYASHVEKDLEYGKQIGVKSTPTFFVNGKMVNGAHPIDVFDEIIKEAL